jgi:hypothetical protein
MPFPSKTYRISFTLNGKHLWEIVTAWSSSAAIQLVAQRYPGATSFFAFEE